MTFTKNALSQIQKYQWPGNVRELINSIERAIILSDTEATELHTSQLDIQSFTRTAPQEAITDTNLSLDEYFITFVRDNENSMSETELAKQLGISRKTLWERRQKLGIPRKKS